MMTKSQLFTEADLLKKQLAEETKEKYKLYKRIKELTEEINKLKENDGFYYLKKDEKK